MEDPRIKQFYYHVVVGDVIHDKVNGTLHKVISVVYPGVFMLSKNNDYASIETKAPYHGIELLAKYDAEVVSGDRLSELEKKYSVKK